MLLVISLVLALLPLLGIVWIAIFGTLTTVDGLFNSLILLAISGIFALNIPLALRKKGSGNARQSAGSANLSAAVSSGGSLVQRGRVESVQFFESAVGQPNKSLVSLSHGNRVNNVLVFEGDMRNALPEGRRVEIAFRKASGYYVLLNVSYC